MSDLVFHVHPKIFLLEPAGYIQKTLLLFHLIEISLYECGMVAWIMDALTLGHYGDLCVYPKKKTRYYAGSSIMRESLVRESRFRATGYRTCWFYSSEE